ncbi:MAG: hypothetical protein M0P13_08925 [Fibrobacteraceae bacterium]|nr:hypothetical protein [Fibrobacteraceae bacterium]
MCTLAYAAFTLIFTELKYEESDDFYLASMLSGAYGDAPNACTMFVNTLFGFFLKPLYLLFPEWNWFLFTQLFFAFFVFALITYILFQRLGRSFGLFLAVLVFALFGDDIFVVCQWTKSAEFLSMSGALFLIYSKDSQRYILWTVIAFVYMLLGSWVRYEGFLEMLPFMLLLYAVDFFGDLKYKNIRQYIFGEKRFVLSVFVFILILLLSLQVNKNSLSNEGMQLYRHYNGLRASVMDYSRSDMVGFKEDIEEAGLNMDDYKLFKNWVFYDPDVFSKKNVQTFYEAARDNSYGKMRRIEFILNSHRPVLIMGYPIFWAFCAFFLCVFFTNRKKISLAFLALLVVVSLYVYLLYVGRLPYRVEFGLWFGGSVALIWLIRAPQKSWKPSFNVVLLLLLGFWKYPLYASDRVAENSFCTEKDREKISSDLFYATSYTPARYLKRPYAHHCFDNLKRELASHPENLYMLSHLDMIRPQYCWFGAYKAVPVGYFKNQIFLGFWTIYWPDQVQSLKERGIENPIKELVNDNVYVVGKTVVEDESLRKYLVRHYYDSVRVDLVKTIDGVDIYKFRAVK